MKPQARSPAFAGRSTSRSARRAVDSTARQVAGPRVVGRRRGVGRHLTVVRHLSVGLLLLGFSVAHAQSPFRLAAETELKPHTLVEPPGISLEQATNIVRRQTGGRVLSAAPAGRGGNRGYEVRVLVDGKRVTTVFVDSRGNLRSRD